MDNPIFNIGLLHYEHEQKETYDCFKNVKRTQEIIKSINGKAMNHSNQAIKTTCLLHRPIQNGLTKN